MGGWGVQGAMLVSFYRHGRWQSCWRRVSRLLCLGPPAGNTTKPTTKTMKMRMRMRMRMRLKMEMKMEMPHACGIIESDMAAM